MKKFARPVLWLAMVLLLAGCFHRPVPSAIKTEISFIDTAVRVGIKEAEAEADVEVRSRKLLKTLKRIAPHTDNLLKYAEGKSAE